MSGSSVQPPAVPAVVPPVTTAAPSPPADPSWSVERGKGGKFLPGSGGRPRGVKNKVSRDALASVQSLAPEAIAKLADAVRQGSLAAIKIVLEATLPRGGRTIDMDGSADPNAVIEAFTTGEISPDEFARIAQAWKSAADAADLSDIKEQVEALETLITAMRK